MRKSFLIAILQTGIFLLNGAAWAQNSRNGIEEQYRDLERQKKYAKVLKFPGCTGDLDACNTALTYYPYCGFTSVLAAIKNIELRVEDGMKVAYVIFMEKRIDRVRADQPYVAPKPDYPVGPPPPCVH